MKIKLTTQRKGREDSKNNNLEDEEADASSQCSPLKKLKSGREEESSVLLSPHVHSGASGKDTAPVFEQFVGQEPSSSGGSSSSSSAPHEDLSSFSAGVRSSGESGRGSVSGTSAGGGAGDLDCDVMEAASTAVDLALSRAPPRLPFFSSRYPACLSSASVSVSCLPAHGVSLTLHPPFISIHDKFTSKSTSSCSTENNGGEK